MHEYTYIHESLHCIEFLHLTRGKSLVQFENLVETSRDLIQYLPNQISQWAVLDLLDKLEIRRHVYKCAHKWHSPPYRRWRRMLVCGMACQRLTCQVTESSALREIDLIARIIGSQ